ncbi:MAG: hypothetical protein AABX01_01825 [Candidatus Micrarchaeota archaeon]
MAEKNELEFWTSLMTAEMLSAIAVVTFALLKPESLGNLGQFNAIILGVLAFAAIPYFFLTRLHPDPDVYKKTPRELRFKLYPQYMAIIGIATLLFQYLGSPVLVFLGVWLFVTYAAHYLVNFFVKASAHASILTGLVTLYVTAFGPTAGVLYLLVPVSAYMRLKLQAHSIWQIIWGILIGLISALITTLVIPI